MSRHETSPTDAPSAEPSTADTPPGETPSAVRVPIASFHLVRHRGRLRAMLHLALGRRRLQRTPGLSFWRLLGTGSGSATGPGADLRRTALFAIWDDATDLDRFVVAYAPHASERYLVRLRAIGGHGSWKRRAVLAEMAPAVGSTAAVAIVTRAHVRLGRWRRFRAAGPSVSDELQSAAGLLAVVGIGEAPVGNLGTFSLWRSAADATAFARDQPHHHDVVRRTRAEQWYAEELFARFEPYASEGTWDGRDPLG